MGTSSATASTALPGWSTTTWHGRPSRRGSAIGECGSRLVRQAAATVPAYPDNAYLTKIGTLAYAVARLEWLVLGDLTGQADRLPQYLTVTRLAGLTTGQIAKLVSEGSVQVDDSAASEWL